ncbi:MAG: PIN domain-containing protein [Thermoanaerobaculia bacterium]
MRSRIVVVDTSVVSYLLKNHSLARHYWRVLAGRTLAVSFMTVAELYRWPFQRQWGEERIARLRQHLTSYAVLPYDDRMSWEWARVKTRKGHPISDADAWIACAAIVYEAPLVTHNARHFLHIDELEILTVSDG